MDNARERRFGNGREPRVLWKNHADFIAILLQMVLQIAGKRKRDRTSRRGCTMSCRAGHIDRRAEARPPSAGLCLSASTLYLECT